MSLDKQETQIVIAPAAASNSAWTYNLKTQNVDVEFEQVNYGSAFDEAVDGSLRSNLRGYRPRITVNYDAFIDGTVSSGGTTFEDFFEDIYEEFVDEGVDHVLVRLSGQSNSRKYVPSDFSRLTRYRNQIAVYSASLEFVGQELITSNTSEYADFEPS